VRCSSFADARSRDDSRSWCHAGLATAPSLKGASVTTESQKAGVTTEREKASATTERQRASDSDCDSLSLPWGPKSYALGLQLVQRAARLGSKELTAWGPKSFALGLQRAVRLGTNELCAWPLPRSVGRCMAGVGFSATRQWYRGPRPPFPESPPNTCRISPDLRGHTVHGNHRIRTTTWSVCGACPSIALAAPASKTRGPGFVIDFWHSF
jgi:hypothetical protein